MMDAAEVRGPKVDRQRILLIDDEPDVLRSVAKILDSVDYEVTCLPTVAQAQRCMAEQTFHLVLSDLYLDGDHMGYEIAAAARQCKPEVPVVVMTGRPSFGNAQAALRSHVSEIVVKPIDGIELVQTCRRTIRAAASERRQRQLEGQNKVLASVLPRAIEAKDPTTSGHAERVVLYTATLADRCGVSAEDREHLKLASLLHDVGKIGIPEEILTKAGPLTAEERKIIETHPEMGRQILAPLEDSEEIRTWVYQHHEKWDGSGYPRGLAGEEVALPGRILVLAEVYDALAEPRSYKPAWPNEKIIALFRAEAGTHFDPDLAHLAADGLAREGRRFFRARPDLLF